MWNLDQNALCSLLMVRAKFLSTTNAACLNNLLAVLIMLFLYESFPHKVIAISERGGFYCMAYCGPVKWKYKDNFHSSAHQTECDFIIGFNSAFFTLSEQSDSTFIIYCCYHFSNLRHYESNQDCWMWRSIVCNIQPQSSKPCLALTSAQKLHRELRGASFPGWAASAGVMWRVAVL